jgi:hypothetical protein
MIHIYGIWAGQGRRTKAKALRVLRDRLTLRLESELLPTKREVRLIQKQNYIQTGGN